MFHSLRRAALVATVAAAGVVAAPLAQATTAGASQQPTPATFEGSVGTGWMAATVARDTCIAAADAAARDAGFTPNPVNPGSETVFAGRNGDVVAIRCMTNARLITIFYHVAGEDGDAVINAVGRAITVRLQGGVPAQRASIPGPTAPTGTKGN